MGNKGETIEDKLNYKEGIYSKKNWDAVEFPMVRDCISDKETAIKAAEIFLSIESLHDETLNLLYNPIAVFYDIEDKIWIVSFSPFQDGMPIPGESYNIAIRRDNAEVIKMWTD